MLLQGKNVRRNSKMMVRARKCKASRSFQISVRLCIFVGTSSAVFTLSCCCQGWRCLSDCGCKTTRKTLMQVCLAQRPGPVGESEVPFAKDRGDRRLLCWGLRGRNLSRKKQPLGGCSPFLWAVVASVVFAPGPWCNAGRRAHGVIGGGPSVTHLGERGRIDRGTHEQPPHAYFQFFS